MLTSSCRRPFTALLGATVLALVPLVATPAHAAWIPYSVNFTPATGSSGSGSFLWDDDLQQMSRFSWHFDEGRGEFLDSALNRVIYSPGSARSVGALFYHLFTDPVDYWTTTYGLVSTSQGYFTQNFWGGARGDVLGDFPPSMFAIGYRRNDQFATYEFLNLSAGRTVVASGTVSAQRIPEPHPLALLFGGLGVLALAPATRRRLTPPVEGRTIRGFCTSIRPCHERP